MTARPDPALALSAVEVESLRQLRARLNKPAAGDAAKAVLGKVFLEVVARVGLDGEPVASALGSPADVAAEIDAADMGGLRGFCARLAHVRTSDPRAFARLLEARVPQSIISRRLALAGREPAKAGAGG